MQLIYSKTDMRKEESVSFFKTNIPAVFPPFSGFLLEKGRGGGLEMGNEETRGDRIAT
jgi:hypothetical protein